MGTALWIARGLLALAFLLAGGTKAFAPPDELRRWMAWVAATPIALARCIGIAKLAGAIGLILPVLTRIAPRLAIAAAIGLALVMAGATVFHATRKEYRDMAPTIALLGMALFVAVGQSIWAPLA